MVHIKFDPNSITLSEFDLQIGQGEYNYFRGSSPYQRGYGYHQTGAGVGDFLRSIWRAILPSLKSVGKVLGREALSTGSRVLDKVAQGENLKETLREETVKGVDNLLERGGIRRQTGGGTIKELKTHSHKIIPSKKLIHNKTLSRSALDNIYSSSLNKSHFTNTKRSKRRKNRADAFGLY